MRKVSREEFYRAMGPLDVVLSVQGKHPYKTVFKYRNGEVVGVDDTDGCCYLMDDI